MVCWDDCDSKAATARSRQSSVADDEETLAAAELASLIKSYSAALSQHGVSTYLSFLDLSLHASLPIWWDFP